MRVSDLALVTILAAIPISAYASKKPMPQLPRNEAGRYEYTEVVKAEGVSADVLFGRARAWAATSFRDANHAVKLSDETNHRLVVKGVFGGDVTMIDFTLTIETKDGRWRYVLGELGCTSQLGSYREVHTLEDGCGKWKSVLRTMLERVDARLRAIITSLREAMADEASPTQPEW